MTLGAGERLRRALRWPAATGVRGLRWLGMQADAAVAFARIGQNQIRARHRGRQTLAEGGKVAVFAHFDRDGHVHDYVLYYLAALGRAGFAIVFVSNAPRLDAAAVDRLLPHVAMVLHRRNVGYDFAAYKQGLAVLGGLTHYAQVLLANDSVYGPFFDLSPLLHRCDARADVWGITDSREHGYHLQSYFLLFRPTALASPALAAFWRSVRPVRSRQWVIRHYEVGLTQALRQAGLRCAALFPCDTVIASRLAAADPPLTERWRAAIQAGRPVNVMHLGWDHLITAMGCPFVKRELLMYNPLKVPHTARWPQVIGQASGYDTALIAGHLRSRERRDPADRNDA